MPKLCCNTIMSLVSVLVFALKLLCMLQHTVDCFVRVTAILEFIESTVAALI